MHLQSEINEQADVLSRLLDKQRTNVQQIAAAIRAANPAYFMLAARGTSDNAARYAQYVLGSKLRIPVALSTPSLHTLYDVPPNLGQGVVIGISQSGQARDVRKVLEDANADGGLTIAITNYPDSPMAQTAKHHICLDAGEELSIAATKTYTAQLTAIAMLAAELSQDESLYNELIQVPVRVQQTLGHSEAITNWAERYRFMERFAVIGRGFNYATAFEISLKIKELTYIIGEGYSEADFRHGPIATVSQGFPVILIAPQGRTHTQVMELGTQLVVRGAELLIISNDDDALTKALKPIRIPAIAEWLSPIVAVIPGQVFAMHQAQVRGLAVDKPRGLQKVTITE